MSAPGNAAFVARLEQTSAAFQRIVEALSISPVPPQAIQEAIALAVMEQEHCGWLPVRFAKKAFVPLDLKCLDSLD
jgi:hypothetical protein